MTIQIPVYAVLIIEALLTGLLFLGIYTLFVMRKDYLKDKEDFNNKYVSEGTKIEMPYYEWCNEFHEDQLN